MPTHPTNARIMLKQEKARVIQRTPFTLQLLYDTTDHIQAVTVGIDDGGINIGIAAISHGKVLFQQELLLRSDIKPKSKGGTDKLSNLMTLCKNCHDQHHSSQSTRSDVNMQKPNNHKPVAPIPPPLNQRFRRGLLGGELNEVVWS